MSIITDAQDESAVRGNADEAAIGASIPFTSGTRDAAAVTFTTGTARTVSDTKDMWLYITIKTAAALTIAMGPTSSVAVAISPSQSSALGTTTLFVPAGWYVKLTGTMVNLDVMGVEA